MNNNGFSLMRYFRRLGVDAHLFTYANDGVLSLSHFTPEADTWSYETWRPFVHATPFYNGIVSGLRFPWNLLFALGVRVTGQSGSELVWPVRRDTIRDTFSTFDYIIGSGIAPALLSNAGRILDIFYPYSMGVEFLNSADFADGARSGGVIRRIIHGKVRAAQTAGVRKARIVINPDSGPTEDLLKKLSVRSVQMSIPMVYNMDALPAFPPTQLLNDIVFDILHADLIVFHHARLIWKRPVGLSGSSWAKISKNSDWLLRAFADFRIARPKLTAKLVVIEYGPDVEATKQLVEELGIGDDVLWLPKIPRREIAWILSRSSVVCGEFYQSNRVLWGGTGWEALAAGKPLLQGFRFGEGEYERILGHPQPPILEVQDPSDITRHLVDMADHPDRRIRIGEDAQRWFSEHNGIAQAKRWLALLDPQFSKLSTPQA